MNIMTDQTYDIGYWADTKRSTQTHVRRNGVPVCGSQISEKLEFQWCSSGYTMNVDIVRSGKKKSNGRIDKQTLEKLMAKKKFKKEIRFWESYKGTIIDKGAKEEIKRAERRYNKHRAKSTKHN